jgi:hypothetical protein
MMGLRVWQFICAAGFALANEDEDVEVEWTEEQEWSMARARGADRSDLELEKSVKLGDLYSRKNDLVLELASLDEGLLEVAAGTSAGGHWGSCKGSKGYGCDSKFVHWHGCQCNTACKKYNSCCNDYDQCGAAADPEPAPVPSPATPAAPIKIGSGPPYGRPSKTKSYPSYPGFTLWLVEEFDEAIDLDKDLIWTWSDGGLGEGDVRFVRDQISFKDGKMIVEVTHNKGQTPSEACSHAEVGNIGHKPLLSGEFRTRYNMFRYGRYEVNMKAPLPDKHNPRTNGNYISTMFVYRDAKYENWREIDIEITADSANAVTTNMLNADHTSGWKPGIQKSVHGHPSGINVRTKFNTYMFEWLPNQITWFINGKKVRTQKQGGLRVPDMPGKIMMNLWIFRGGGFGGGSVRNNRYPMQAEYDWFRFYKWDKDPHYPCGPDGACLGSKDKKILSSNNPCDNIKNEGRFRGHICVASKRHCNGPH